jgi:hypothetical protein
MQTAVPKTGAVCNCTSAQVVILAVYQNSINRPAKISSLFFNAVVGLLAIKHRFYQCAYKTPKHQRNSVSTLTVYIVLYIGKS